MTVTYSDRSFLRLLFRWRGSVYKNIWKELLVWVVFWCAISNIYRFGLSYEGEFMELSHLNTGYLGSLFSRRPNFRLPCTQNFENFRYFRFKSSNFSPKMSVFHSFLAFSSHFRFFFYFLVFPLPLVFFAFTLPFFLTPLFCPASWGGGASFPPNSSPYSLRCEIFTNLEFYQSNFSATKIRKSRHIHGKMDHANSNYLPTRLLRFVGSFKVFLKVRIQ